MDFKKLDNIKVNFIVGHGRSGTTLLVVILNHQKNIIASPEVKHLLYFYKKYKNIKVLSQEIIDDYKTYLQFVLNSKKNPFFNAYSNDFFSDLKPGLAINFAQLSKWFYLCLVEGKADVDTIDFVIDKNPYYTFYINELIEIFPNAKILALVRDYRAYILSNRQSQKPSVTAGSVMYYAAAWNRYIYAIILAKNKFYNQILVVNYERIALEKEKTIKEIFNFFDITFTEDVFNFHVSVKERIEKKIMPIKKYERMVKKLNELSSPINASRVYSWKTQLSNFEILKADFMCGNVAQKIGYTTNNPSISLMKKLGLLFLSLPGTCRVSLFMHVQTPQRDFVKDKYLSKKLAKYYKL